MTDTSNNQDITWTDDFLIGIDELDYEHKSLLEDVNILHRELLDKADLEDVKTTLGRLHERLQAHFALEEMVMSSKDYIDFAAHKEEHDSLLGEYTEMMINYEHDQTPDNRRAMENTLRKWLVEHILNTDKKMSYMLGASV
ncbi:MAG: bacteriohemerythrin [Magnetovibrio sp.]|nr:bacteriohemerythrin [Magnetovibrio sp.]